MSCFWCCSRNPQPRHAVMRRRSSYYGLVGESSLQSLETSSLNAAHVKIQQMALEELTDVTYGLALEGVNKKRYEAQDFFLFKEILGCGATAVVFRGIFKPTGEVYAIKFIPDFKSCKTVVLRELVVLKVSKGCRELIYLHSHFRVDSNLYFVLELCEGGTLESLLSPNRVMPMMLGRVYLKQLVKALFFLHSLKVVHRDVSLCNCLLTRTGHLKLGDFGLCRTVDDPVHGERMTICGNASIRAPELYLDKPCSFGVDWWSMGILLYRFITGYFPFHTDKLTVGHQSVTKLKEKYPDWVFSQPDAKDFCQKLLIKDPKKRLGYDDEVTAIKGHPFFAGVDWKEDDNMEQVVRRQAREDVKQYEPVLKRLADIMDMDIDVLFERHRSLLVGSTYKGISDAVNTIFLGANQARV